MRPFLEVRRLQEKEQKWYSGMLGVTFNAEEGRITIFRSTLEALGMANALPIFVQPEDGADCSTGV